MKSLKDELSKRFPDIKEKITAKEIKEKELQEIKKEKENNEINQIIDQWLKEPKWNNWEEY